jgi:hypothetical protein
MLASIYAHFFIYIGNVQLKVTKSTLDNNVNKKMSIN